MSQNIHVTVLKKTLCETFRRINLQRNPEEQQQSPHKELKTFSPKAAARIFNTGKVRALSPKRMKKFSAPNARKLRHRRVVSWLMRRTALGVGANKAKKIRAAVTLMALRGIQYLDGAEIAQVSTNIWPSE